jgi:hypothetical protein
MLRGICAWLFFTLFIALGSAVGGVVGGVRQPQTLDDEGLKRAIEQLHGVYTWRGDLDRWDYSAKAELEVILSKSPSEHAVGVLIGCLDDTSMSASVLDGKPVALGIVCYQGLSQLVYYEPSDNSGDIETSWPGFISPKASKAEMKKAKIAWKKAQDAKLLIFQ